jgi:hypothetical protein
MAITLTQEDGTGLANANVYATLDQAAQYLENTGRKDAWSAFSTAQRSAALIQGTDYLDQKFRRSFKGIRFSSVQRLEWPRAEVYNELGELVPADEIPEDILNASIEFAFEAAGSPLAPTPAQSTTGGQVTKQRDKVDVLETETMYSDKYPPKVFQSYPRAKLVLRRWLRAGAGALTARI